MKPFKAIPIDMPICISSKTGSSIFFSRTSTNVLKIAFPEYKQTVQER